MMRDEASVPVILFPKAISNAEGEEASLSCAVKREENKDRHLADRG
jgi:hypothetical protein